jgi:hypothetical protein
MPEPDQPKPAQPQVYEGGCHCGAVRFRVRVTKHEAIACNCSICRQKGFLHVIVPAADFTLQQGEDALSCYRFNTGIAQHLFCKICGIHSFYRPRSHPEDYDVNLHCLDGLDQNVRDQFQIVEFDGANWEANVSKIIS